MGFGACLGRGWRLRMGCGRARVVACIAIAKKNITFIIDANGTMVLNSPKGIATAWTKVRLSIEKKMEKFHHCKIGAQIENPNNLLRLLPLILASPRGLATA